jgi:MFS family permease
VPAEELTPAAGAESLHPEPAARLQSVAPETFLRLAWLANPLAYVAIYALLAVMPGIATRLGLSPSEAGVYGSVWFFGRLVAFVVLWQWTGWHYRFRWLLVSYALMTGSFIGCLLAPSVAVLVTAEAVFGLAVGLIYSSSLFYAMDIGTAKAEHGGWHEALIGAGIFAGPAVAAGALQFFPGFPSAGAVAVLVLLLGGFVTLLTVWHRGRNRFDAGISRAL